MFHVEPRLVDVSFIVPRGTCSIKTGALMSPHVLYVVDNQTLKSVPSAYSQV